MKKAILMISFLVAALTLSAEDILYLNNGNVIKGTITAEDETTLTIVSTGGREVVYPKIEIRKVEKDAAAVKLPSKPIGAGYTQLSDQYRGWWCAAELNSALVPLKGYAQQGFTYPIEVAFVNGYRTGDFFAVGIGFGIRYYIKDDFRAASVRNEDNMKIALPLFLNLRGSFLSHHSRVCVPCWSVDAGYAFYDRGAFVRPTLGLKIGLERHNAIIGVGYQGAQVNFITPTLEPDIRWTHGFVVKLAYEF